MQHCWPQCECLEPPDLSDFDDTDEKFMLNFNHSQTHDLVRVKAAEVGLPIVLVALGLSLSVMLGLIPGTMA